MKKRGLISSVIIMIASLLPTNLHARSTKSKIKSKSKTTHVTKNRKTKKTVSKKSARRTSNTGIYALSRNNRSPVVEKKMTELRKYHEKVAKRGTASQKKQVAAQKKLLSSYSRWRGTRYSYGGDSRNGIDCSALTRRVYREVYNKELPRVSTQQVKRGVKVSSKNLKPGDILFFKPEGRNNHTTVYVGNSLFINASSSKGVTMSSLQSPYWKKYYKYAVRVNKNT